MGGSPVISLVAFGTPTVSVSKFTRSLVLTPVDASAYRGVLAEDFSPAQTSDRLSRHSPKLLQALSVLPGSLRAGFAPVVVPAQRSEVARVVARPVDVIYVSRLGCTALSRHGVGRHALKTGCLEHVESNLPPLRGLLVGEPALGTPPGTFLATLRHGMLPVRPSTPPQRLLHGLDHQLSTQRTLRRSGSRQRLR